MWNSIAKGVLKFRMVWLAVITAITIFMGYHGRKADLAYNFARVIPSDNQVAIDYDSVYQKKFGDDGEVLMIGVQPKNLFDLKFFSGWYDLGKSLKKIEGVTDVVSIANSFKIIKDTVEKRYRLDTIFMQKPTSQVELDSLKNIFTSLPFYQDRVYVPETNTTLMAVRINHKIMDSKARLGVVHSIIEEGNKFGEAQKIDMHYSGLPVIRTVLATQVADELKKFLILAVIVTALVLLLLLRSLFAVVASLLVVGVAVTWCMGTIVLCGFKITLLTGLIPPLVVVIGITNCVYLLNKYHIEFLKYNDKFKALTSVVEKIGLATLFTNLTAAIGFGVFFFTKSTVLKEFGLVAGLNIAAIFFISVILIPCIFSFLPAPKKRHTGYLDYKALNKFLGFLDKLIHTKRKWIFAGSIIIAIVSIGGIMQLKSTGFIVDDIPHSDKLYTDLVFFQTNFKGVMPFDIVIETKKKGGALKPYTLNAINELQDTLANCKLNGKKVFSAPLSIVEGIKFLTQAFYDDPNAYRLPNSQETFVYTYINKLKDKKNNLMNSFLDSTKKTTLITVSMADIGSTEMKKLMTTLRPKVDSIFSDTSKFKKVTITGTSIVFLEGNRFIINGLRDSLLLAFLLIAICMGYLFRSFKMILFSLIPNLIPLAMTAGTMGYFHIPLKPSTVLIYSIAFGIAIDNAIRFLAKYQQELHRHDWDVDKTVSMALYEAGISIIYTSIILFFGFIIFTASSFGGTFYLGLLTSITLVVAMFNNLLLLPSLLLALKKWSSKKSLPAHSPADDLELDDVTNEQINEIERSLGK